MSRGKGKRYKIEEIIRILKEAESNLPIADLLRKHNISVGTYYRWKSQYSGMEVSQLRELLRLKRIVAEQVLSIDALKDVNSKNRSNP